MVPPPYGLYRAFHGEYVPNNSGCLLEMDRSATGTICNFPNTVQKHRSTFAMHGLPEVLVSDNGTAFTSIEFQEFT